MRRNQGMMGGQGGQGGFRDNLRNKIGNTIHRNNRGGEQWSNNNNYSHGYGYDNHDRRY